LKEIRNAISAMLKGKAPGCDSVPTEFFQEFVEEIYPTLLQAFSAMFRRGETSETLNKGLITLIPSLGIMPSSEISAQSPYSEAYTKFWPKLWPEGSKSSSQT